MTAVRILLLIGFAGCIHHNYDWGAVVMLSGIVISIVVEERLRMFINNRKG